MSTHYHNQKTSAQDLEWHWMVASCIWHRVGEDVERSDGVCSYVQSPYHTLPKLPLCLSAVKAFRSNQGDLKISNHHWKSISNCLNLMHAVLDVPWLKWANISASLSLKLKKLPSEIQGQQHLSSVLHRACCQFGLETKGKTATAAESESWRSASSLLMCRDPMSPLAVTQTLVPTGVPSPIDKGTVTYTYTCHICTGALLPCQPCATAFLPKPGYHSNRVVECSHPWWFLQLHISRLLSRRILPNTEDAVKSLDLSSPKKNNL
jgi:hypothetical protein